MRLFRAFKRDDVRIESTYVASEYTSTITDDSTSYVTTDTAITVSFTTKTVGPGAQTENTCAVYLDSDGQSTSSAICSGPCILGVINPTPKPTSIVYCGPAPTPITTAYPRTSSVISQGRCWEDGYGCCTGIGAASPRILRDPWGPTDFWTCAGEEDTQKIRGSFTWQESSTFIRDGAGKITPTSSPTPTATVSGNETLPTRPGEPSQSSFPDKAIIGICVGAIVGILLFGLIIIGHRRYKNGQPVVPTRFQRFRRRPGPAVNVQDWLTDHVSNQATNAVAGSNLSSSPSSPSDIKSEAGSRAISELTPNTIPTPELPGSPASPNTERGGSSPMTPISELNGH